MMLYHILDQKEDADCAFFQCVYDVYIVALILVTRMAHYQPKHVHDMEKKDIQSVRASFNCMLCLVRQYFSWYTMIRCNLI